MSWFMKILGNSSGNVAEVNSENALKVVSVLPSGNHFAVAAKTGTMAAAIAGGGAAFVMRLNPAYSGVAYIDMVRLRWTPIVAFTTPITQTRSLVITRGAGAAASGGTALSSTKKDSSYGTSNFDTAAGGSIQIASTAALTVTGITFETNNFSEITLAHVGAAGNYYEANLEFWGTNHPVELRGGELLAVRVGASAMDAAGTWSLGVDVYWRESTTEA
jgi:hypothetical protein